MLLFRAARFCFHDFSCQPNHHTAGSRPEFPNQFSEIASYRPVRRNRTRRTVRSKQASLWHGYGDTWHGYASLEWAAPESLGGHGNVCRPQRIVDVTEETTVVQRLLPTVARSRPHDLFPIPAIRMPEPRPTRRPVLDGQPKLGRRRNSTTS